MDASLTHRLGRAARALDRVPERLRPRPLLADRPPLNMSGWSASGSHVIGLDGLILFSH